MNKETKFKVGDKAHKPKGYKFPCTIVGVFETIAGEVRVIGEMDEYGLLHIFNENQLEHYGKEQQELLDEAYENYLQHYDDEYNEEQKKIQKNPLHWMEMEYTNIRPYPKQMFINKCKTDPEFSEKWGLTIEERELSRKERSEYYYKHGNSEGIVEGSLDRLIFEEDEVAHKWYDERNVPTKLITITHNDKTIESYE